MIEIDGARLIGDLRRLAEFGKYGTGVDRIAFSQADIAARLWFRDRLAQAGLEASTDLYGNVLGRWPGAARAVLVGSHTDTVPRGGWLDGALGAICGLEIARALREGGADAPLGVDVVSFQDEEGSYLPCLGSKAVCGLLDDGAVAQARGAGGESLPDAIARAGFSGPPIRLEPGRHVAFLEVHIEQGPRLIAAGVSIGVVTGIVGIRRMTIEAQGRADHAGTTPMAMRENAALPLFRLAAWLEETMPGAGTTDTVWNIGTFTLAPGAANVVPGHGALGLEFRDTDMAVLDRIEAMVRDRVEALRRETGIGLAARVTARIPPSLSDRGLCGRLAAASRALGAEPVMLPSGAGHDCMVLAQAMPAAMLFVPSIGGRSHDIAEDTDEADIVLGCRVLARTVAELAQA